MPDFQDTADGQTFDSAAGFLVADGEAGAPDLFDIELERYIKALETDPAAAMRQYGFTLFHSLPPLRQVEVMEKAGMAPTEPNDYFARASLAISRGDFKAAVGHLQKCLAAAPEHTDAVYNLALCHEKLGNKSQAIQQWNRFLEMTENAEDRASVEAHLAELGA